MVVGHVTPEAAVGGPIAVVRDGDFVRIDASAGALTLELSEAELECRLRDWQPLQASHEYGVLGKFARTVCDASHGAVLDPDLETVDQSSA
jgi:dihydroxy-acid dehydratase